MDKRHQISWKHLLTAIVMANGLLGTANTSLAATDGTHTRAPATSGALVAEANPHLQASKSVWRGASYAEWTQRWWQWYNSIPLNVNPSRDDQGTQCGINQAGPVWFIGGPLGSTFERSCTIPQGTAILSPIADFLNDYPCPDPSFQPAAGQTLEDFLIQTVAPIIEGITVYEADLDGQPLPARRVTTGLFPFTAAADLVAVDSCVTGSPQLGVSDGYFLFIEPLPPGEHTLHIHSEIPSLNLSSDGTYHLTITK